MLDFDRYSVLTFDCYGTLIDWESGILAALRPVLDRHGVTAADDEVLERYAAIEAKLEAGEFAPYGRLLRSLMEELAVRFGFEPSRDEIGSLAESIPAWQPFPDTVASLERLKTKYKLAIVSNIEDSLFAHSARHLRVPFDFVVTAELARAYKPSHAVFERALDTIALPREQILHVAQSIYHDIVPARALGLSTVWVNRRHGLEGAGATPPAAGEPDVEVPDLATLARMAGVA